MHTLDTPLYDISAHLWDKYAPADLHLPSYLTSWQPGISPLSETKHVLTVLALYLGIVLGGQALFRGLNISKVRCETAFVVHNFLLSIGSPVLLVYMLEQVLHIMSQGGFYHAICAPQAWTSKLEFLYMLNYYFKYVELLDTLFLVIKKKELKFLHVYHHAATALLCFTQLEGRTSVSWLVIVLNLFVHVVMYYYYYATARGIRIPWKRAVTTLQITQFVVDLRAVYFATYNYITSTHFPHLPHVGPCTGSPLAAGLGCGLLTSYLLLFIEFYLATYKQNKGKKRRMSTSFVQASEKMVQEGANTHLSRRKGSAQGR